MGYVVTAGFVTAETNIGPGRARIDIPRGSALPDDVPADQVETLLARGAIALAEDAEPEGPAVDLDGDGVPDGSVKQVIEWVGSDLDRAALALEAEQAKGDAARSTVVGPLSKLLDA
jgi:hypothetical protein